MFWQSRINGLAYLVVLILASPASAAATVDLTPRPDADAVARVSITFEAGGHNVVRTESDDKGTVGQEQKLPMSVSAKMRYDERRLIGSQTRVAGGQTPLAVRYYDEAEAVIKVGDSGSSPKLADDRRLIVVESGSQRPGLYCPAGPLTREQLDLVDLVGNPIMFDRLLPAKPVADGDSWPQDASVMAGLLTLDTVAVCEVQSVLEEYNTSFAKVRIAGVVHGTADGAATEQEVRGVYLFDRRQQQITRFNLAVREQRLVGGATPGVDGVAKLQITIEPLQSSSRLGDEIVRPLAGRGKTPVRELLYDAPTLGFRARLDRQWFITAAQRQTVTLRRVDGGDLVAQCTVTALAPKSSGRQTTLEQFQKDIVYSLGKSFGQVVSNRQWQNSNGHFCYEVVVRGTVEEMPVEWHYYLVAQESGHRVSLVVTLEAPHVERVADADRALVDGLQLFAPMPAAKTASRNTEPAK